MEDRYAKQAIKIMEEFEGFTDGVRLIMLLSRKKDSQTGEETQTESIRELVRDKEELQEVLAHFLKKKDTEKKEHRIYVSLNSRDMKKALRLFRQRQLDADYYGGEDLYGFYLNIKDRFISSAMSPACRAEKNFLIDIDEDQSVDECVKRLIQITRNYKKYQTKNGWHIICQPFDPRLLPGYEIKKDGLMLFKY